MNWIPLETETQLQELIERSFNETVLIFKHSTRCFISKMALRNFENTFEQHQTSCYLLDLITYRNLSNKIAQDFEITHQSPQLLIIKNGIVVYHSSHESIDAEVVTDILT